MRIKKIIRNPNGLTLLELLAVVVILGIISAIAVPTFSTIIENTKKDAHISNAIQIAEAAKTYINSNSLKDQSLPSDPIKLETLITEGYIFSIKDPSISGGYYDQIKTTVKFSKTGSSYQYYVKLSSTDHFYITDEKDVYTLTRKDITLKTR